MKALTYAGTGLAVVLMLGGPAVAQNTGNAPGNTSGPATGGNVKPSTAVQKDNPAGQMAAGPHGGAGQTAAGSMGAGAPGMAAKPGSEAGPAPKSGSKKPAE
jgi:hypothetical protein